MRSASAIYCFNLEHSCLVRSSMTSRITLTDFFGFRLRHLPWRSCLPSDKRSSTQRFHAAMVAPMYRCFGVCSRSSVKAYSSLAFVIDRIGVVPVAPSLMHRLANPFAVAHASPWRQDRPAAKPVKTSPLYDPTRLPSKGALLRLASCDTCRAHRGTWFRRHASLLDSGGFAATGSRTTPLH